MISSEKEIGTCVLTKMLIYSIIAHKFRYPFGSDINPNVYCVTDFHRHHSPQQPQIKKVRGT